MKKSFLISIISTGLLCIAIESCNNPTKTKSDQSEEKVIYQCPMDCEKGKTYDKAGQCPECNMDLEKGEIPLSNDSTQRVN